jgi:hypothetical protein
VEDPDEQAHYTLAMRRLLRTALMWLVATALPLQALAAATMFSCGAGHQQMAAPDSEPAGHDHAAHGHDAASSAYAHGSDSATHGDPSSRALHPLAKFKCSACAACCVASALPSASMTFDPPKQTAQLLLPVLAAGAEFLTGGPERPPRSVLV